MKSGNKLVVENKIINSEPTTKHDKITRAIFYMILLPFVGVVIMGVFISPLMSSRLGIRINMIVFPLFVVFLPFVISFFLLRNSGMFQRKEGRDDMFKNQQFKQIEKISIKQRIKLLIKGIILLIVTEFTGTFMFYFFLAFSDSGINNIQFKILSVLGVFAFIFFGWCSFDFFAGRVTIKRCGYFNKKIFLKEVLYAVIGVFFPALSLIFLSLF